MFHSVPTMTSLNVNIKGKGFYQDIIPVEEMNIPDPPMLLPLATHLGIDLAVHPFPHSHSSAHATDRTGSDGDGPDATDDPEVKELLRKLEIIYKDDVWALAKLVAQDYPHANKKTALSVSGIFRHDAGIDQGV